VLDEYVSTSEGELQPHLTGRELDVLRYLVKGKSNKEIALILGISPKTVSVHRSSVMMKLKVRSSIELLRYVEEHHLLE
jgi:DNA-binding NarL/FixJ family response regulator